MYWRYYSKSLPSVTQKKYINIFFFFNFSYWCTGCFKSFTVCVCILYKLVCKFELGPILYIYSRPISFKNIWFPFYSLVLIIRKDNHTHLAQRHPYKDNRKKKLLYTIYKEIVDVWIDWIFHSHISVYIYRHKNVCVRKTGWKRHPILYLSSYRFLIHSIFKRNFVFIILPTFFYVLCFNAESRKVYTPVVSRIFVIYIAGRLCVNLIYSKQPAKFQYFSDITYTVPPKKRHWRVCVGVKSSISYPECQ